MKSRPILFNTQMVRALLEGKKTQTRRMMKPQPKFAYAYHRIQSEEDIQALAEYKPISDFCPYGQPGDLLWVREPHAKLSSAGQSQIIYRADALSSDFKWCPSIFMKKYMSRLTLEIQTVRILQLQQINEQDAMAEGMASDGDESARISYAALWDRINGEGSWASNPWVWALTFKVRMQNIDEFLKAAA